MILIATSSARKLPLQTLRNPERPGMHRSVRSFSWKWTPPEEYFHQFNRTYLEFTTIRRVVGPDQKNSFVMCAMMQPDAETGTIDPEDISYKFKVSIQEVTFNV